VDAAAGAEPTREGAPPDRRFLALAALLGAVGFAIACLVVDRLARAVFYGPLADAIWVRPFSNPAAAILAGGMPYRDVAIEYPPLSLPVFLLPALLGGGGYERYRGFFEVLMTLCGMGVVPLVVATVARLGARRSDVVAAVVLLAASPLLIGPITISRYDLWPALLTAGAVAATVFGRRRVGFALLGLGILAKVYPAVLLPILLAEAWRRAGRREALIGLGIVAAVGAAVMAPFVLASPSGALDPFLRTLARPLQVESLGASLLVLVHDITGLPIRPVVFGFGSYNLDGALPQALATLQSVAMLVGIVAVWALALRGSLGPRRFVLAVAAAIVLEVGLGKVFSPQYVLWLVPVVAVLAPVRGPKPLLALAAIIVMTSVYYPSRYTDFITRYDLTATLALVERNLGVLLFGIWLTLALRRGDEAVDIG